MMASNSNHPAHYPALRRVNNNGKNAGFPQSPACGAASVADDRGMQNIDEAMTMMTMTGPNAVPGEVVPVATKENVRPNSGGTKKKWRRKANKNQRRVVGAANAEGPLTAFGPANDDNQVKNTAAKTKVKQDAEKIQLKTKKAVVVEISPQEKMPARPILPSMDDVVVDSFDSNSPSSNGSSNSGNGRNKKTLRPKKSKNSRRKPKAKKGDHSVVESHHNNNNIDEFSTNAGGASVLALLGQYPYMHPMMPAEGSYNYNDGGSPSSPPSSSGMNGDNSYHPQYYDPTSSAAAPQYCASSTPSYTYQQVMQYPTYASSMPQMNQQQGGATTDIMMPATAGYYVPIVMTQHNGAVYYNQQAADYPAYYQAPGYAPYGTTTMEPQYQEQEGMTAPAEAPGTPLNIDAPAFNPQYEEHYEEQYEE